MGVPRATTATPVLPWRSAQLTASANSKGQGDQLAWRRPEDRSDSVVKRVRFARSTVGSAFARAVMVLASGTAIAQLIALAATPLATRLYGPDAFGVMGAFMAVVAVLAPVAALTYPTAIVVQPDDRRAVQVAQLSIILATASAMLVAAFVVLGPFATWTAKLPGTVATGALLLTTAVFFSVTRDVGLQWIIRKQQFGLMSKAAVIQATLVHGAKLLVGLVAATGGALITIVALGPLIHSALLVAGARRDSRTWPSNAPASRPSFSVLREAAVLNRDFPRFRAPHLLINRLSQSLPVIMLVSLFGSVEAGYFTAALTLMMAPVALLGKSVEDALYPRVAAMVQQARSPSAAIWRSTLVLAAVAFVPFAVLAVWSQSLFPLLLGREWTGAGTYASWLSFWIFFLLIGRPSIAAIAPLGLQGQALAISIASLILRAAAILTGGLWLQSDVAAVALFSLSSAITNFLQIILVARASARVTSMRRDA